MWKKILVVMVICFAVALYAGIAFGEEGKPDKPKEPDKAKKPDEQKPEKEISKEDAKKMIDEAKAVFKKLVDATNAGKIDEAKKFISKKTLEEAEKAGQLEMALKVMTHIKIDEFAPKVINANRIDFVQEKKEKVEDGIESSSSITIHMIKEGGQWKFGKE